MQSAGFAISKGLTFSVYGENVIVLAQNIVIMFLVWNLNKQIGIGEKVAVFSVIAGYGYVLFFKQELI